MKQPLPSQSARLELRHSNFANIDSFQHSLHNPNFTYENWIKWYMYQYGPQLWDNWRPKKGKRTEFSLYIWQF